MNHLNIFSIKKNKNSNHIVLSTLNNIKSCKISLLLLPSPLSRVYFLCWEVTRAFISLTWKLRGGTTFGHKDNPEALSQLYLGVFTRLLKGCRCLGNSWASLGSRLCRALGLHGALPPLEASYQTLTQTCWCTQIWGHRRHFNCFKD